VRTHSFNFTILCHSSGTADVAKVEQLLDLALQDLVFDDKFIEALDENEAVTIHLQRGSNDKQNI
jgi:hypothetical protein